MSYLIWARQLVGSTWTSANTFENKSRHTTVSDLSQVTKKVEQLSAMIVTLGAPSGHHEHAVCQIDSGKGWPVAPLMQLDRLHFDHSQFLAPSPQMFAHSS